MNDLSILENIETMLDEYETDVVCVEDDLIKARDIVGMTALRIRNELEQRRADAEEAYHKGFAAGRRATKWTA